MTDNLSVAQLSAVYIGAIQAMTEFSSKIREILDTPEFHAGIEAAERLVLFEMEMRRRREKAGR